MVLGNYYLTMEKVTAEEGRVFKDANEALMAYERGEIDLHTRLALPVNSMHHKIFLDSQKDKYLVTTVGKLKFNEIFPDVYQYINEGSKENIEQATPDKYFIPMGTDIKEYIHNLALAAPIKKKTIQQLIGQVFKRYKTTETSAMLDRLKDLGFKYSTKSGITMSVFDIMISDKKDEIIEEGKKKIEQVTKQFNRGLITDDERYEKVVEIWNGATAKVQDELAEIAKHNGDNPVFIMMDSGARGSMNQFSQMAGMRGLIAKPDGKVVEIPVTSNLKEGMSVSEYFITAHGNRKGIVDTALKTANSGYLTRRLVDVVQDVVVKEEDCGTIQGVTVRAFINDKDGSVIESLRNRIVGRFTNKKVINHKTKEVIVDKDEYITENLADKIINAGIEEVKSELHLLVRLMMEYVRCVMVVT